MRSRPPRDDGGDDDAPRYRQEEYVFEAKKAMAIRPANLRYEPRSVEGLTASEMRGAMRVLRGDGSRGVGPESLSGMDKDELRRLFREEVEALVAVGGGEGRGPAPRLREEGGGAADCGLADSWQRQRERALGSETPRAGVAAGV